MRKINIIVTLTDAQAERLEEVAIGEDMCSDDSVRGRAFGQLWRAIKQARKEANELPQPDVRSCSRCGREVAHSRRGRGLAFAHKCPHGATCERSALDRSEQACRACRKTNA